MDYRESGNDGEGCRNDGEGCRNDGEGAGNDGLVLWSPYPKWGLTGTFTSPYGKGWSARMAGHNRTLSTNLPQRPTRPWGLTPASPYPKLGLTRTPIARSSLQRHDTRQQQRPSAGCVHTPAAVVAACGDGCRRGVPDGNPPAPLPASHGQRRHLLLLTLLARSRGNPSFG